MFTASAPRTIQSIICDVRLCVCLCHRCDQNRMDWKLLVKGHFAIIANLGNIFWDCFDNCWDFKHSFVYHPCMKNNYI